MINNIFLAALIALPTQAAFAQNFGRNNSGPTKIVATPVEPKTKGIKSGQQTLTQRTKQAIVRTKIKIGLKKSATPLLARHPQEPYVISQGELERSCCASAPGSSE